MTTAQRFIAEIRSHLAGLERIYKGKEALQLPPSKPRSLDDVTRDYTRSCAQLGGFTIEREELDQRISEVRARCFQLQAEGRTIQEAAKAAEKVAA